MKRTLSVLTVLAVVLGSLSVSQPAAGQDFGKTLTGKVVFDGDEAPKREELKITKDQQHCLGKGPILSEDWVVNSKNLGVKDVFVWLEPMNKGGDIPVHPKLKNGDKKTHVIDQPRCMFVPHCLVIQEGDILLAKNSSPIPHNFRWLGHPLKNPGGNIAMAPGTKFEIKNLQADLLLPVMIKCDIHPWMNGYVRVFDHPYASVTDENGDFKMELPPAGQYRLKIWHPASGWVGGFKGRAGYPVDIKADADTDTGEWEVKKK